MTYAGSPQVKTANILREVICIYFQNIAEGKTGLEYATTNISTYAKNPFLCKSTSWSTKLEF